VARALAVDARYGAAGDMFLAALVNLGGDISIAQSAVDQLYPGLIHFKVSAVERCGVAATYVDVIERVQSQHSRDWSEIEERILNSSLNHRSKEYSYRIFELLAQAEAFVHEVDIKDVHFHEVGSADSIADIVGVAALLDSLDISSLFVGELEIGSGTGRSEHGEFSIPAPATRELIAGWRITNQRVGEALTPTGAAIIAALGYQRTLRPTVVKKGYGAGTRNPSEYPNVLEVSILENVENLEQVLIESNIDDIDPRLIPVAIEKLMAGGALDAWVEPIMMKKNRPGFTVKVLCTHENEEKLGRIIFEETTSIGYRTSPVSKVALERHFKKIDLHGATISIKISLLEGRITQVSPEFDDVNALAKKLEIPTRVLMDEARRAAHQAGYKYGEMLSE